MREEEFKKQVARAIYGLNLPFRAVEHPEFREALRFDSPHAPLPTRKALAGKYLDMEYDLAKMRLKDKMDGKFVTLSLDGWSTDTNTPVMGVACDAELVAAIDTTGKPHTSDYVKECIIKSVDDVQRSLNVVVAGVVTDSASNMAGAREMVRGEPYITYACQAHLAHLVCKDFLADKARESTMNMVVEV